MACLRLAGSLAHGSRGELLLYLAMKLLLLVLGAGAGAGARCGCCWVLRAMLPWLARWLARCTTHLSPELLTRSTDGKGRVRVQRKRRLKLKLKLGLEELLEELRRAKWVGVQRGGGMDGLDRLGVV